jgi:hypothetical protein
VSCAADAAAQLRDRQTGTEADLKDPAGGLHIEQRDHPAVAVAVGRAVRHLPDGHAPGRAPGITELADDVVIQGTHSGTPGALNGRGHRPPDSQ